MLPCRRIVRLLPVLLAFALLIVPPAAPAAGATVAPELAAALEAHLAERHGPGPAPIVTVVRSADAWVFGTLARPAPAAHAAPLAYLFLAEETSAGWIVGLEGEPELADLLRRAPKGLLSAQERDLLGGLALAAGGEAGLSLPFGVGETWYLTGGPHPSGFDGNGVWSAIDFAGGSGIVRAARDGLAYLPCPNLVKIYHPDGFQTGYYHLADIAVSNGQPVERGAALGRISDGVGCGGQAFGAHLHFWLMHSGVDQTLHGVAIGGWTVQNGAAPYQGCMIRLGDAQCAGGGRISSDGAIGDGSGAPIVLQNPSFESDDDPAPWQANGACAYFAPSDPQQARDGSRYLVARNPGGGCLSILQDVAVPPQPGATYRLAVWARSADGSPRTLTLALWALGPDPRSAGIDISLQGQSWHCYETALTVDSAGYGGLRAELYIPTADGADYLFDGAVLERTDAPLCPFGERYSATVAGMTYPSRLDPGAVGEVAVTLRNTGSATWDADTFLAPLPRNEAHILADPSWPAGGTRIVDLSGVAPAGERTVRFSIRAPETPGQYQLQLGIVQERQTWFAEPDGGAASFTITVEEPELAEPLGDERIFLPLLQH